MKIQIISQVKECIIESVYFEEGNISGTMSLESDEQIEVILPKMIANPICDADPIITSFQLNADNLPEGFTVANLVTFDLND